jgi:hypothetical protein
VQVQAGLYAFIAFALLAETLQLTSIGKSRWRPTFKSAHFSCLDEQRGFSKRP